MPTIIINIRKSEYHERHEKRPVVWRKAIRDLSVEEDRYWIPELANKMVNIASLLYCIACPYLLKCNKRTSVHRYNTNRQ